MHAGENDAEYFILAHTLEKKRCLLVSFIMKLLICKLSLIYQFISWMMRSLYGLESGLCFTVCSFSKGEKNEQTCMKKSEDLQIICKASFQAGLANTHSVKKKKGGGAGRSKQEKPLKFLILRKMVMLSHLMADKCCLPVTWTECRQAICVSKLSRSQDWKAQDSKSNNYLYFLESAHGAPTSCRDVPGSCAWVLSTFWQCSHQLFAHKG